MSRVKYLTLGLMCSVLTACGGGGSSDSSSAAPSQPGNTGDQSNNNNQTPIVYSLNLASADNKIVNANELSTVTIALSEQTNSSKKINYSVSTKPARTNLTTEVAGQVLTIKIAELENDEQTILTLIGEVEGKQDSVELTLNGHNASAEPLVQQASIWQQQDKVFKFDDLTILAEKYVKAGYFAGKVKVDEQQELIASFNATLDKARVATDENQALVSALQQYLASTITESQLQLALTKQKQLAQNQSDRVLLAFKSLSDLVTEAPELPASSYQYIAEYEAFSALIGNLALGQFQHGKWHFTGQYQFLNQMIPVLGTPSTCDIN